MATQFGIRLSLIAFATVVLRGAMRLDGFEDTLRTGLYAAGAFFLLGLVCGEIARRLIEEVVQNEHLRRQPETAGQSKPTG